MAMSNRESPPTALQIELAVPELCSAGSSRCRKVPSASRGDRRRVRAVEALLHGVGCRDGSGLLFPRLVGNWCSLVNP